MSNENESFLSPDSEVLEISENTIGNLYAALGNNEAKAITFSVMKPNVIYNGKDLDIAIRSAQGDVRKGWKMGFDAPFHYCQKDFEDIYVWHRK